MTFTVNCPVTGMHWSSSQKLPFQIDSNSLETYAGKLTCSGNCSNLLQLELYTWAFHSSKELEDKRHTFYHSRIQATSSLDQFPLQMSLTTTHDTCSTTQSHLFNLCATNAFVCDGKQTLGFFNDTSIQTSDQKHNAVKLCFCSHPAALK